MATGSLGQGLPIGVGLALTDKKLDQLPYRVWVLCGDSEMAEGSMWEAFQYAAWAHLDNLTAIVGVNRPGQTRQTMLGWDLDGYATRTRAFGWQPIIVGTLPASTPKPSPLRRGNYSVSSPSPPRPDPADYWTGEPRW